VNPEIWMAAASLIVSVAVLIFGAIQYRAVARKDYVEELSSRVDDCEERHDRSELAREECERERERLQRMTVGLIQDMRDLSAQRNAQGPPPEPEAG
jgi:hypothetical protein